MAAHDPGTPAAVLIVEDEPLVAMFLTDLIEDLGHVVLGTAATPEAALLAAAQNPPPIAVVDANLGGRGDGIALAGRLQDLHATRIIFLSGDSGLSADPAVRALNPLAVLQKPCPPGALEAALRSAVPDRNSP